MTPGRNAQGSRDRRAVRYEGDCLVPEIARHAQRRRWLSGRCAHRYDDARVACGGIVDLERAVARAPAEGPARLVLRQKEAVQPAQQRPVQRLLPAAFALTGGDAGEGLLVCGAEVEEDLPVGRARSG